MMFRRWRARRLQKKALRIFEMLDAAMLHAQMPRAERRQFYRDLIAGRLPEGDAR